MNKSITHYLATTIALAVMLVHTPTFAETYSYDSSGRLTGVTYDDGSSIVYTYDNAGNIVNKTTEDGNDSPTSIVLVSPADLATDLDTTVTFVWKVSSDPNGDPLTYRIFICENDASASCPSTLVAAAEKVIDFASIESLVPLVLFGTVLGGIGLRRRKWLMMAVVSLAIIGLVSSCSGGGGGGPAPTLEKSHTAAGLKPATTYFWKVSVSDGIDTVESATRSFTTL